VGGDVVGSYISPVVRVRFVLLRPPTTYIFPSYTVAEPKARAVFKGVSLLHEFVAASYTSTLFITKPVGPLPPITYTFVPILTAWALAVLPF